MAIKNKFKEIFLYGGLGWGLPFAVFMSIWRWIEYKSPAFGSLYLFFIISIVAGCFVGGLTLIFNKGKAPEELKVDISRYVISIAFMLFALCIYGLIYRYVVIPKDLNNSLVGTFILLILIVLAHFVVKKTFLVKDKNKKS